MKARHIQRGRPSTKAEEKLVNPSSSTVEHLTQTELSKLREAWWFHRRNGTRLPAQRGIIILRGGRS